jgi:hypothetical protein
MQPEYGNYEYDSEMKQFSIRHAWRATRDNGGEKAAEGNVTMIYQNVYLRQIARDRCASQRMKKPT